MVEELGTPKQFPDEEVWKIAILDLRLMNLDRNGENILVKIVENSGGRRLTLVPIDHGACYLATWVSHPSTGFGSIGRSSKSRSPTT